MQQFHLSRKLLRYTHAWTKLHNKVMSWISGAYECHYAWPLPEVNTTTVRDLMVPSVSSQPLSVMVRSCTFISLEFTEHGFVLARVQIWNPFTHLNFWYMAMSRHTYIHTYVHTYIHTYIHTYTRVKQCSHASVVLAQARPNYLLPRQHHCRRDIQATFLDVA